MEKTKPTQVALVAMNTKKVQNDKKVISTSDMTRRMICGGLAGMVAKVGFFPNSTVIFVKHSSSHQSYLFTVLCTTLCRLLQILWSELKCCPKLGNTAFNHLESNHPSWPCIEILFKKKASSDCGLEMVPIYCVSFRPKRLFFPPMTCTNPCCAALPDPKKLRAPCRFGPVAWQE